MSARPSLEHHPDAARDALLERARRAMIGQFEILGTTRHESLAAAYAARDVRNGDRVQLRVFRPELFPSDVAAKRFARQMAGALGLRSANVVTARAVEIVDSLVFLVTDAVPASSLDSVLGFEPMLAAPVARSVLVQMASALAAAHAAGVIHGGVRPSAIMISTTGDALLADLGLVPALATAGAAVEALPSLSSRYQSPDTIRTGFTSEAADQYSLGVVAYEMLMGRPPFLGDAAEVRNGHLTKRPPEIENEEAEISPELAAVVMRMLGKSPRERFATMADVLGALETDLGEFEDRAKGPLSWLAQRTSAEGLGDEGVSPPARRRTIVQTPLPFADALPALQQPTVRPVATTAETAKLVSIEDLAPTAVLAPSPAAQPTAMNAAAIAALAGAAPAVPKQPFGRALQAESSSSRGIVMTAVAMVVLAGGVWIWRSVKEGSRRDEIASALSQTRETVSFQSSETKVRSSETATPGPAPSAPAQSRTTVPPARGTQPPVALDRAKPTGANTQPANEGKNANVPAASVAAANVPTVNVAPPPVVNSPPPSASTAGAQTLTSTAPVTPVVPTPVTSSPVSAPPPPAAAESRPAPRITDADADRAARSVLERLRASDFDALAQGMGTSRTDRDFMAWLRRRPVEMKVGDARPNVTVQPDGSARVSYSVPISWTHASGAKPVRNASIVVTVNDSGKIAGWTLAAPFVP